MMIHQRNNNNNNRRLSSSTTTIVSTSSRRIDGGGGTGNNRRSSTSSSSPHSTYRMLMGLGVFSLVVMYIGMTRHILQLQTATTTTGSSPSSSGSSSSFLRRSSTAAHYIPPSDSYYADWNLVFSTGTTGIGGGSSGSRHLQSSQQQQQQSNHMTTFAIPIVARPRCLGYYFRNETSTSYIGTEQLDPNLIHLRSVEERGPNSKPHYLQHQPPLHLSSKDWERQVHIRDDSDEYADHVADQFEDEGRYCEAQYEWQKRSFPTCNHIMEIDMNRFYGYSSSSFETPQNEPHHQQRRRRKLLDLIATSSSELDHVSNQQKQTNDPKKKKNDNGLVHNPSNTTHNDKTNKLLDNKSYNNNWSWEAFRMIAHGYWRDVWKVEEMYAGSTEPELVAMKTMRYKHEYTPRNFDRHRRDAVAMERLTSSQFIVNIYAACGNSGLFEYADGGSLEDSIWFSDNAKVQPWTSQERLVVAYQVASSIAQVHNVAKEGVAAIAHADISPGQFVYVDKLGMYRLNDFNRARFIGWNKRTNQSCPFHVGSNPGNFRSPEEYAYEGETEKIDVYSLGNTIYGILTALWPFEELEEKKAKRKIKSGLRPPIPPSILNSTDPYDQVMLHAIEMCWIHNPTERATARQVQNYITDELKRLTAEDRQNKSR